MPEGLSRKEQRTLLARHKRVRGVWHTQRLRRLSALVAIRCIMGCMLQRHVLAIAMVKRLLAVSCCMATLPTQPLHAWLMQTVDRLINMPLYCRTYCQPPHCCGCAMTGKAQGGNEAQKGQDCGAAAELQDEEGRTGRRSAAWLGTLLQTAHLHRINDACMRASCLASQHFPQPTLLGSHWCVTLIQVQRAMAAAAATLTGRHPSSQLKRPASRQLLQRLRSQSQPQTSALGTCSVCTQASCARLPCRCAARAMLQRYSVNYCAEMIQFDRSSAQKPACLEVQVMHALGSTSAGQVFAHFLLPPNRQVLRSCFASNACDQTCYHIANLVRCWAGSHITM